MTIKEKYKIILAFSLVLGFFWTNHDSIAALQQYSEEGTAFYALTNSSGYTQEGVAFYAPIAQTPGTAAVYRLYSQTAGDHFYTTSEEEKNNLANNPSSGYVLEGVVFYSSTVQSNGLSPIYRFYNRTSGDHFYTASASEKDILVNNPQWGYAAEGIAFYAYASQSSGASPVYRLYNSETGDHFYTSSETEKNNISVSPIYRFYNTTNGDHFFTSAKSERDQLINSSSPYAYEGTAFYAYNEQVSNTFPVYRFYSSKKGAHFYTANTEEKNILAASTSGYTYEGVAFYAFSAQINGSSPVYRLYNATTGFHFYTISAAEKNYLVLPALGPDISVGLWSYTKSNLSDTAFTLSANKNYNIKDSNGNIIAKVSGSTKVKYDSDSYFKVYNSIDETRIKKEVYFDAADGDNTNLIFDVNRPSSSYDHYRGKIKIRYTDSSNIWVINILPLEHYAWGAGETTGTGDADHTRVMSTMFRTYGYWYIKYATKYNQYGFKIKSTSDSQIYWGYDWETNYPNVKKAAQDTRGVIVSYDSDVALTPYSSWSDGKTRSFKEVWGSSDYPWCKSVSDPYGKHPTMNTQALQDAGNHMVGLIAHGSLNLATDHDWNWDRILKYYYSGVALNGNY